MTTNPLDNRFHTGVLIMILGVAAIMCSVLGGISFALDPLFWSITFSLGLTGFIIGSLELARYWNLSSKLRVFVADESALGWQLLVFIAAVLGFALVWFVVTWPVDIVYNTLSTMYTFTGFNAVAVNFAMGVISLLLGIGLFFTIIWLWVNANRRESPYY
ncbi:MAG: hypothetical protein LBC12_01855 [Nitrososphaerota archaeon]|jgi:hypothetical protein|nr:hypothetical protein [Nitrososphaerota archaeon]